MKIGIFDSGYGGRLALEKCKATLPKHDFIGFFDHANAPYGDRTAEDIYQLTKSGCQNLYEQGCDLILLACNTASAQALRRIQESNPPFKVLGCLIPAIEQAIDKSIQLQSPVSVGILATQHTVKTRKYQREAFKIAPNAKVFPVATPKLVPWIENGQTQSDKCQQYLCHHIQALIDKHQIDTLILGCTHYGVFTNFIQNRFPTLKVVDSAQAQAEKLVDYLKRHQLN